MAEQKADQVLDVRGLTCPMPALKTKKAITYLKSGEVLQVLATDPATKTDIPALLKRLNAEIMSAEEDDGLFSFLIRKH